MRRHTPFTDLSAEAGWWTAGREGHSEEMDVQLLYLDGCPHRELARTRLSRALTLVGRPDDVVGLVAVRTEQEARERGFPGSPTIRVNGRDPFPHSGSFGLSCRVYPTPEGLAGAPTVDQLVRALTGP